MHLKIPQRLQVQTFLQLKQAKPFPIPSYSHDDITSAWSSIHKAFPKPDYAIRAAVFNIGHGVWKPFLDITPQDVQDTLQTGVAAAFSFSRGAILSFKENEIEEGNGKKGTLIFTGATSATRGNVVTSAFSASKFGARALSQSLAKEFGKENIHVAHVSFLCLFQLMSLEDSANIISYILW